MKLLTISSLIALNFLLVSCNSAEKFTAISGAAAIQNGDNIADPVPYNDVLCREIIDQENCLANKDLCQPVYKDGAIVEEKSFVSCVANVDDKPKEDVVIKEEKLPVKDDVVVVKDEVVVVKDKKEEVVVKDKKDEKECIKDKKEEVIVKDEVEEEADDEEEVVALSDCSKLDAKYLIQNENGHGQPKVIVCHSSGNGEHHAISVACPALKAHVKHQDGKDYLGACKE